MAPILVQAHPHRSDGTIDHEPIFIFIVEDRPAFRLIVRCIPNIVACDVKIMVEKQPDLPVLVSRLLISILRMNRSSWKSTISADWIETET